MTQPHSDPNRQRLLLKLAVIILLAVAFIILIAPGPIPKPLRVGVALTDLIAAATIWLLGRQKLPPSR
jgi:Na+/H+ antiporter NhaD/arsenite permease-like protein